MMAEHKSPKVKVAFITGITGQDGSYLSELLLDKGYEVHGLVRPTAYRRQALNRPMRPGLTLHFGDLSDVGRLLQILGSIKIDEVYHLAAQSHVRVSFEMPVSTGDVNALGTLRLLEAMKTLNMSETTRFYNAATSELFGSDMPAPQNEETTFHPVSPYAVAKQFAYWTTVNYREACGFHASNGILFNHESPRRGTNFVTRKITSQVATISCGLSESFELGNLDAIRDWGHAKDYMNGVYLMLQQPQSGDYVLATGEAYSVRDFVEAAFKVTGVKIRWSGEGLSEVGYDEATSKIRVKVNPDFYRPLDNQNLLGSAEKARKELGWKPKYNFYSLVEEMVLSDVKAAKNGTLFASTYLDWLGGKNDHRGTNGSVQHDSNGNGVNGQCSITNGIDVHDANWGKPFTSETFLIGPNGNKASAKVTCRWRFSESPIDVYALRHFHCLDLLMKIVPVSQASTGNGTSQGDSLVPRNSTAALERLVDECRKLSPSEEETDVTAKVILVPRNGFLCRSDILALRMRDSELVDTLVQFSTSDNYFPEVYHGERTLPALLSSSPGALLLRPSSKLPFEALDLLEEDLKIRLSFDWVLPNKPAERRVALVGGRPRYNVAKGSFGHKGTFDAAHGLGISVVVVDRAGHWLENDDYSYLREAFVPVDMTDDEGLPSRLVDALKGREIDGIVTFSDEVIIPTAKAAEAMDLPTESVRSIMQAHNKYEARKLLSPNVQTLRLDNTEQLKDPLTSERLEALHYPIIVKPCTGGGSRGVKKVTDALNAREAISKLDEDGLAKRGILLETYVDGPEIDANFVLWDGEILFFEVLDELPCEADASDATVSDNFAETIMVAPSQLDAREIEIIRSTLHRGLLQLGLRSGVFHVEARVQNSSTQYQKINGTLDHANVGSNSKRQPEVFLIEVNARAPGLMAVWCTAFTHGVDYSALLLLRALGDRERFTALSKSFTSHAQYWTGLIFATVPRKNVVIPDDFCGKVIERVPDIAPYVSRAECMATSKMMSPVGGTGFVGYFMIFSRKSSRHVLEMSQRIRDASTKLLDSA